MNSRFNRIAAGIMLSLFAMVMPAYAEISMDLRTKLGTAAGASNVQAGTIDIDSSGGSSRNLQVELAFVPQQASPAGYVFTAGLFRRNHSGKFTSFATLLKDIDYTAVGAGVSGGLLLKASDSLHVEGRFEFDLGKGKPTFSDDWGAVDTEAGQYEAASLILGSYYTIASGFQIGLELGYQQFDGKFKAGFSLPSVPQNTLSEGKVTGNAGTAAVTLGYRF